MIFDLLISTTRTTFSRSRLRFSKVIFVRFTVRFWIDLFFDLLILLTDASARLSKTRPIWNSVQSLHANSTDLAISIAFLNVKSDSVNKRRLLFLLLNHPQAKRSHRASLKKLPNSHILLLTICSDIVRQHESLKAIQITLKIILLIILLNSTNVACHDIQTSKVQAIFAVAIIRFLSLVVIS